MKESEDSDAEELTDQQLARAIAEMLDCLRRDKCEDMKLAVQEEDSES